MALSIGSPSCGSPGVGVAPRTGLAYSWTAAAAAVSEKAWPQVLSTGLVAAAVLQRPLEVVAPFASLVQRKSDRWCEPLHLSLVGAVAVARSAASSPQTLSAAQALTSLVDCAVAVVVGGEESGEPALWARPRTVSRLPIDSRGCV